MKNKNLTSRVTINILFPSKNLGNESDFTLHVFNNVCSDKVMECPLPWHKIDIFSQNALWLYKNINSTGTRKKSRAYNTHNTSMGTFFSIQQEAAMQAENCRVY